MCLYWTCLSWVTKTIMSEIVWKNHILPRFSCVTLDRYDQTIWVAHRGSPILVSKHPGIFRLACLGKICSLVVLEWIIWLSIFAKHNFKRSRRTRLKTSLTIGSVLFKSIQTLTSSFLGCLFALWSPITNPSRRFHKFSMFFRTKIARRSH